MMNSTNLKQALFAEREASFFRLRGGYSIPIAGAAWWAALGTAGYLLHSRNLLPFAVSAIYLATVSAILIASSPGRQVRTQSGVPIG
jgi:uncharacterized membrane protein (UPF0136 family)